MLRRLKQPALAEDGQALVELALVLPILLLVVFAIFDFGSAINNWNDETSLANVGARYAAVGSLPNATADPKCGSNATQTLQTYLQCQAKNVYHLPSTGGTYGFQGPISVSVCAPGGTSSGDPVEVNVTATYRWLPGTTLFGGRGLGTATITGAATYMLESNLPSWMYTTLSTTCSS